MGTASHTAMRAQQPDRALRIYEVAIQIDPSSIEAHYGMATAYQSQGKINEAIEKIDNYVNRYGNEPSLTNAKKILESLNSSERKQ